MTIKDAKEGVYTVEQMEAGFDEWERSNVQVKFTHKNANDDECPGGPTYRTQLQLDGMSCQQCRCLCKTEKCFSGKVANLNKRWTRETLDFGSFTQLGTRFQG